MTPGQSSELMIMDIAKNDLKNGAFGLVVALVKIIKEALRLEVLRRMEGGSLQEFQRTK